MSETATFEKNFIITYGSSISIQLNSPGNSFFLSFPNYMDQNIKIINLFGLKNNNFDYSNCLFQIIPCNETNFKWINLIKKELVDLMEEFSLLSIYFVLLSLIFKFT